MSALSLPDAKRHLNLPLQGGDFDDELQAVIDAAEDIISARTGPLTPQTVTSRVSMQGGVLVLPITPATSVTSVTGVAGGTTIPSTSVSGASGIVTWGSNGAGFTAGEYDVVYTAGYDPAPPGLLWAVKEMVRHLWATQRGPTRRPGGEPQAAPPGYLIPNAVAEAIAPYEQHFGFA